MSTAAAPNTNGRWRVSRAWGIVAVALVAGGLTAAGCARPSKLEEKALAAGAADQSPDKKDDDGKEEKKTLAPELEGGIGWLNTAGPIRIKDLRGKIVVLDFWTFCCINCLHTLTDLARLEKKYAKELVVIGVHSAKFDTEKESENIRKAILRYEINHPVVNDADMKIWRTYGARSWPTIYLIDPEGYVIAAGSGEGLGDALDREIGKLVKIHKDKKTLDEKPRKFELARFSEKGDSPLFFPGKILADEPSKRLFIADSTHHRIVITDLQGKKIAIAGVGEPGKTDGAFDKASFNDPQGLALKGETLYVADRKNHLIRALDLKNQTVKTVAGSGQQGEDRRGTGPALKMGLNSPWDVLIHGDKLYIAQAGHHQIWTLDLKADELSLFAGSGREDITDGPLVPDLELFRVKAASFAQPSGLTTDGKNLYVADSESSSVRSVPLNGKGEVRTLVGVVGVDLFQFGDEDGVGEKVRLQHALGVAYHDGKLYVADTYNSKIKVLDPTDRSCETYLGGEADGWLAGPTFSEPGGLSVADGKLFIADTNAHRIRVVDLKTKMVRTLELSGVQAPKVAEK
jgi:DNA-binding beta-propeller fold protein YncE